jgi:hypothetical protein
VLAERLQAANIATDDALTTAPTWRERFATWAAISFRFVPGDFEFDDGRGERVTVAERFL